MFDTNYIGSIVKIFEIPNQIVINNNNLVTRFRVQLPQFDTNTIVNLTFWGDLALDLANYYNLHDYILIEGYVLLEKKLISENFKKVEITVLKVYPYLLNSTNFMN